MDDCDVDRLRTAGFTSLRQGVTVDHSKRSAASERIVHATLTLIAERGLVGVTMSAIADRAEVARQTLYNHYADVETIVSAAVEQHQSESVARLTAVLATVASPQGRLEHLVRHTAATAVHGHPLIKQGFSAEVQAVIDGYDQALRSHIESILNDGIEHAEFRGDLHPTKDAVVVQRMIEAAGELAAVEPESVAEIVTAVTATVLAAVTVS
jgi:AcrR family transcriptional regulator